jgi:glutaredoxin
MSNNLKTFLFILLAVFLVSGGLIFMSSKSKKEPTANLETSQEEGGVAGASTQTKEEQKDSAYIEKLAKFMSEKGMVMYGAYWCPHCNDQKKLFGEAFKYIDYVECDAKGPNGNPDECVTQGIEGYPTWIYQGKKYSGYKTFSELAQIVGFNEDSASN